MIRITITPAAHAAIAGTLPWGTVGVEPKRAENGDYFIWVAPGVVAKLRAARGPGESYSDVILRVAKGERA
jgi:aconitase A